MTAILWRAFVFVSGTVLGRGILLFLGKIGIRPEERMAAMLGFAYENADIAAWILAGTLGLVSVAAVEVLKRTPARARVAASTPGVTISGSDNVASIGQRGGITARTVINEAPPPELRLISAERKQETGCYVTTMTFQVVAPYPPASLYVEAHGKSIIGDLDMGPMRTGPIILGHTGTREGFVFSTLYSPAGSILVRVRTKDDEKINLTYAFG